MATLQQEITERFLEELSKSEHVTQEQCDALHALLQQKAKPKATDIEAILSAPEENAL